MIIFLLWFADIMTRISDISVDPDKEEIASASETKRKREDPEGERADVGRSALRLHRLSKDERCLNCSNVHAF